MTFDLSPVEDTCCGNLIDRRYNIALSDQPFKIWNQHIADTDGFTLPCHDKLLHRFPSIDVGPLTFIQEMTISVRMSWDALFSRRQRDWPVHQVDYDLDSSEN